MLNISLPFRPVSCTNRQLFTSSAVSNEATPHNSPVQHLTIEELGALEHQHYGSVGSLACFTEYINFICLRSSSKSLLALNLSVRLNEVAVCLVWSGLFERTRRRAI